MNEWMNEWRNKKQKDGSEHFSLIQKFFTIRQKIFVKEIKHIKRIVRKKNWSIFCFFFLVAIKMSLIFKRNKRVECVVVYWMQQQPKKISIFFCCCCCPKRGNQKIEIFSFRSAMRTGEIQYFKKIEIFFSNEFN